MVQRTETSPEKVVHVDKLYPYTQKDDENLISWIPEKSAVEIATQTDLLEMEPTETDLSSKGEEDVTDSSSTGQVSI